MSERFGIPDHAPQHAPDHALQNPTSSGAFDNFGGGESSSYRAPSYGSSTPSGGYSGSYGTYVRSKRSVLLAVILATVFGPFGLFYVNILSGFAALIILPNVLKPIVFAAILMSGGYLTSISNVAFVVMWCITIPWAIIGMKIRNARIDRS